MRRHGRQEIDVGDELCIQLIPVWGGGSDICAAYNQIAGYRNTEHLQTNECNGFPYLQYSNYDTKCRTKHIAIV